MAFSTVSGSMDALKQYQGKYVCYASNELGTAVSNAAILNTDTPWSPSSTGWTGYLATRTILPKEPISLSVTSSNSVVRSRRPQMMRPAVGTHTTYHVLRGQTLELECIVQGLPTPSVSWLRTDGQLSESRTTRDMFDRRLSFINISEIDAGEYQCTANNTQGKVSHTYTVTVEASPYWIKEPVSQLYAPGETVRLDCQADGIPTPTITWSINGVSLSETDKDSRRTLTDSGSLILKEVVFSDTAIYQCRAANKHGTILANANVYVIKLPPQILSEDGLVYMVVEGQKALLECETFGSPKPKITWESESDQTVMADPRVNPLASGDRTVILSPPQALRVQPGKSAIFTCLALVDPKLSSPLIQWRRSSQKLFQSAAKDKYTFEGPDMTVTDIQKEDEGVYTCEVITKLDMAEASGSITLVEYIVEFEGSKPKVWEELKRVDGSALSASLPLHPYMSYRFRLTAVNEVGKSDPSKPSELHNTPVEVPDKNPEGVRSDSTEPGTLLITWEEMDKKNFNGPEFKYRVFWMRVLGSGPEWHQSDTAVPPFVVKDIGAYSSFNIKVQAVNEQGEGPEPKPAPMAVGMVALNSTAIRVTWAAINKDTVRGKLLGYKGEGPACEPLAFDTEEGVPGPPTLLILESPGESEMTLHWTPPVHTNGEDEGVYTCEVITKLDMAEASGSITLVEYIVEFEGSKPKVWEELKRVDGSALSASLPLHPYMSYRFRLTAVNEVGKSDPSKPSELHNTPVEVPDKNPEGVRSDSTEPGTLLITWEEMDKKNFNGPEFKYRVFWMRVLGSGPEWHQSDTAVPPFVVKDIGAYSSFNIKVQAVNEQGEGPEPKPAPMAVGMVALNSTAIRVTWAAINKDTVRGKLLGYKTDDSPMQEITIKNPAATHLTVKKLDRHSRYRFYLSGRTAPGDGEPITREGVTTLDGGPPSNFSLAVGETAVNLSWTTKERHRNIRFQILYLNKNEGGGWKQSERVNSSQSFYQLQGLAPGSHYRLRFTHKNDTFWETDVDTDGNSAIVLLLLLLLILCFIKRSKGGKYSDKEEGPMDSEARPMKGRHLRGVQEKRTASQPSLCDDSKLCSEDHLDYHGGSAVTTELTLDESLVSQYSRPSEGAEQPTETSALNPPPPPAAATNNGVPNSPLAFDTEEGVPGPPTLLILESPGESEMTLHWTPPVHTNGVLIGYLLQYQQIVETDDSPMQEITIKNPAATHLTVKKLDRHSRYRFYLSGRTAPGDGEPITREGVTTLDGGPPSNFSLAVGETAVNLSWTTKERHRNIRFQILYLNKNEGGGWKQSERVNSSQSFYQLQGLAPGSHYRLRFTHKNDTFWETDVDTDGTVKDKEEGPMDSEARPMKDDTFGEYSDNEEKRTASQPSLCDDSKLCSEDHLDYHGGSAVTTELTLDESLVSQYSRPSEGAEQPTRPPPSTPRHRRPRRQTTAARYVRFE
ncbi:hypothetical protein CRUP_034004 [Coryphaenoides rupestris]|nr:hypothetical protein CRUP_034004 [Coryphaenoides rupestris]